MPAASTAGDPTTGHGAYPPTTVVGGSSKVFINGKPALSEANHIHTGHTKTSKPHDFHASSTFKGSGKVNVEGSPALRIGDAAACGDVIAAGSSNVIAS